MKNFNSQLFSYDTYCDFNSSSALAVAGKDILLQIWDSTGTNLLALAGQQSFTLNRSADTLETSSKDTTGGWKGSISGMKEWSIETGGLYVASDASHKTLSEAFENGDPVCVRVVNSKLNTPMYGGIAYITDYPLEAPYDDSMTYSVTLSGNGALVDLSEMYAYPSLVTIAKPSSGTKTATAKVYGQSGNVTAACETSGVTPTVANGVVTISVSSSASAGYAVVTLTDSTTPTAQTCTIGVVITA